VLFVIGGWMYGVGQMEEVEDVEESEYGHPLCFNILCEAYLLNYPHPNTLNPGAPKCVTSIKRANYFIFLRVVIHSQASLEVTMVRCGQWETTYENNIIS
jgi:hypothetical protein